MAPTARSSSSGSEIAFPWATLRRSETAHRLVVAGFLLTAGSALATVVAAVLAPTPLRAFAAAVSLCALIGVRFLRRRAVEEVAQIRVTRDGEILARFGASDDARPMRPLFCAPWLIVLGDRQAALAVWPDRLGEVEFRRLAVASRWSRPARTA